MNAVLSLLAPAGLFVLATLGFTMGLAGLTRVGGPRSAVHRASAGVPEHRESATAAIAVTVIGAAAVVAAVVLWSLTRA